MLARQVAQSVIERIGTLEAFPHLGRSGRVEGTREIALHPLPFIAMYEVFENQVKFGCSASCTAPNGGHQLAGLANKLREHELDCRCR